MLPCSKVVHIISSDESLPWMKRAELKMHLMMCKHCAAYSAHLKMMKDGFQKFFTRKTKVEPEQVEKLESQVLENLKKTGSNK